MKEFKYDVKQLIECVRDRPCLWDKTLENYKDRVERRTAWEEIFITLEQRYDEMTREEKGITEDHIQNKWTNVRDTFVKTLKTKPGKPRRKYLLYEQLKFLTKIIPEEDLTDYNQDDLHSTFTKEEEKTERERTTKKRSKRSNDDYIPSKLKENEKPSKKLQYEVEIEDFTTKSEDEGSDIDLVEIDENEDPRIMNEDEAFFASLLPTIVKYDEDERLQFRIEVLGVMKRIKDNRKWNKNCEAD